MTDKKLFQLVSKANPKDTITPEMKAAVDEMYQEILTGKLDFVMMTEDKDGCGFITNLDTAGCNLLLDQVKFNILLGETD